MEVKVEGKVKCKKCQEVGDIEERQKGGDGFWNEPHQTHVDVLLNQMPRAALKPLPRYHLPSANGTAS